MIRANELVAELLAGRRREALYRVHEPPEPQAVSLLLARARRPRHPDAARARAHGPVGRRGGRRSRQRARHRLRRALRPRPRGVPAARAAGARSRRATTRRTSATWASRARRTATSPRRSAATPTWSSTARCCASSASRTSRCRTISRRTPQHASERERHASKIEYRADELCLAWLLERAPVRARLGGDLRGRDHRRDPVGPVRPLRRRLRGLRPRAAPAGRLLRAERARDRARRPPRRRAPTASATRSRCGSRDLRRSEGKVELELAARPLKVHARAAPPIGWGSDHPPPAVSVATKSARVCDAGVTKACRPTIGRVAEKQIAENRRARHDYHFLDRFEAGLVLSGSEVKSLRQGHAVLQRAYADARERRALARRPAHPAVRAGRRSRRTTPTATASCCCTAARSTGSRRRSPRRA